MFLFASRSPSGVTILSYSKVNALATYTIYVCVHGIPVWSVFVDSGAV